MKTNTGYCVNAESFLAHCDFSDPVQEKFYTEEIAPRLDVWENFSNSELEALARKADAWYPEGFSTENIVEDIRLLVNETIDVRRDA